MAWAIAPRPTQRFMTALSNGELPVVLRLYHPLGMEEGAIAPPARVIFDRGYLLPFYAKAMTQNRYSPISRLYS